MKCQDYATKEFFQSGLTRKIYSVIVRGILLSTCRLLSLIYRKGCTYFLDIASNLSTRAVIRILLTDAIREQRKGNAVCSIHSSSYHTSSSTMVNSVELCLFFLTAFATYFFNFSKVFYSKLQITIVSIQNYSQSEIKSLQIFVSSAVFQKQHQNFQQISLCCISLRNNLKQILASCQLKEVKELK